MTKWFKTKYTGIRYRKHPTRKHGVDFDRYYCIRYQLNGKTVDEAIGWTSRVKSPLKKAIARLAEIEENIRSGRGPHSLKEAREIARKDREAERIRAVTFSEFWVQKYFPSCQAEKKESSWRAEESWFKNWIAPAIGDKPFVDISPIDIERIKSDMAKAGLTPRTVQYCVATVRQVFNVAARMGRFRGDNPAKGVKVRAGDNRRMRFLTQSEVAALLAELRTRSFQVHDMALLSVRCGLRAGEIFSLTWDCIDFDQGTLFIKDTKSAKNRHAYMTADVKKMLMTRYRGVDSGLVFLDRNGGRIRMMSASFFRAIDALGLNDGVTDPRQKVVFHTLRHTFASWLVQAGEPLYTVAKLLGHSTIAMTERYSHLAPDNMRGAVKRMEESLKEQGNKIIKFRP